MLLFLSLLCIRFQSILVTSLPSSTLIDHSGANKMDNAVVITRQQILRENLVTDFGTHQNIVKEGGTKNNFKNYDSNNEVLQGPKSWWSEWSEWSECSQICGGGIAKQTRTCLRKQPLRSFSDDYNKINVDDDDYCLQYSADKETARYRICNMQACKQFMDYRALQCSEYNNQPYDGKLFKWYPIYNENNLCALICRGEIISENSENFPDLIVQFAPKVKDGTYCSNDSLDMCINGKCKRVGCDLQIGSNKKLDRCGVCGGDGFGCAKSTYQWKIVTVTNCSTNSNYCLSDETDSNFEGLEDENKNNNDYDDQTRNAIKTNNSNYTSKYYEKFEEKSDKQRLRAERRQEQKQLICKNIETNEIVENELCNGRSGVLPSQLLSSHYSAEEIQQPKIEAVTESCTTVECREQIVRQVGQQLFSPFKWLISKWSECSADCRSLQSFNTSLDNLGVYHFESGIRTRTVRCIRILSTNGAQFQVNEEMCKSPKPKIKDYCTLRSFECPKWQATVWNKCSGSCGDKGIQTGQIKCLTSSGQLSDLCDPKLKPSLTRTCHIQSRTECGINEALLKIKSINNKHVKRPQLPLYKLNALNSIGDDHDDDDNDESNDNDDYGYEKTSVSIAAVRNRLVPTSEATFVVEDWSDCNATCGIGYRHRNVNCKIYLEFSQTIAKLPDHQCSGLKPSTYERCLETLEPCAYQSQQQSSFIDTVRDSAYQTNDETNSEIESKGSSSNTLVTYSWKEQGYSDCTTLCLGGTQHSQIRCVREDTQNIVSDQKCSFESKPEIHTKLCNEHPCVPRWNYSEFTECSQPCGMGIQMRDVTCVHEISRSVFIIVPNKMCPHPQPADRQFCNVLDCPARWHVSAWKKCSKRCGPNGGIKTRRVDCRQVMAQNHIIDRPVTQCPYPVPVSQKKCNEKPCPKLDTEFPSITISNSSYIQHDPKKEKITLKIGGSATIFYGATIKIKCPTERGFNRSQIEWLRDGKLLFESDINNDISAGEMEAVRSNNRLKHSKRGGTLRIVHASYKDTGMYTCRASKSLASIFVRIKPRPGEFISSEEVENRRRAEDSVAKNIKLEISSDMSSDSVNRLLIVAEDQSHERKTTSSSALKTSQSRTFSQKIDDGETNKKILVVQSKTVTFPSSTAVSLSNTSTKATTISTNFIPDSHVVLRSSAQRPRSSFMSFLSPLQASRYLANVFFNNNNRNGDNNNNVFTYNNKRGSSVEPKIQSGKLNNYYNVENDNSNDIDDNHGDSTNTDDNLNDNNENDNITILGKGNPQNLKIFWYTSNWSKKCPKMDCKTVEKIVFTSRNLFSSNRQWQWQNNSHYYRTRKVICKVQFLNTTSSVNKNICEDAKLVEPTNRQLCFINNTQMHQMFCPKWSTSVWSDCAPKNCVSYQQALQTRTVKCVDLISTQTVDVKRCFYHRRSHKSLFNNYNRLWKHINISRDYYKPKPPEEERHCFQSQCQPVWIAGNWSKCNTPCDTLGLQYRSLGCYWQSNMKQLTNNCTIENRPNTVQTCRISCMSENLSPSILSDEIEHNGLISRNYNTSLWMQQSVKDSYRKEPVQKKVDCIDKYSTFCHHTRLVCHLHRFRRICCKSCKTLFT